MGSYFDKHWAKYKKTFKAHSSKVKDLEIEFYWTVRFGATSSHIKLKNPVRSDDEKPYKEDALGKIESISKLVKKNEAPDLLILGIYEWLS